MSKVKLILIGLAAGMNISLAVYCGWLHYQWNYHRPIITEQHITQQYINGTNATVSQSVDTKKQKRGFMGVYGGYKSAGVVGGFLF